MWSVRVMWMVRVVRVVGVRRMGMGRMGVGRMGVGRMGVGRMGVMAILAVASNVTKAKLSARPAFITLAIKRVTAGVNAEAAVRIIVAVAEARARRIVDRGHAIVIVWTRADVRWWIFARPNPPLKGAVVSGLSNVVYRASSTQTRYLVLIIIKVLFIR